MTFTAHAYLNYNRWVVDCPVLGCTDARIVYEEDPRTGVRTGRRMTQDVCANGHPFAIEMPPPELEAQIVAAVSERAEEADRSWYPKAHVRAKLAGFPVGQTVDDLLRENAQVAKYRAQLDETRRDQLRLMLREMGVPVGADGSFEGII
jgi:hypothetical protein